MRGPGRAAVAAPQARDRRSLCPSPLPRHESARPGPILALRRRTAPIQIPRDFTNVRRALFAVGVGRRLALDAICKADERSGHRTLRLLRRCLGACLRRSTGRRQAPNPIPTGRRSRCRAASSICAPTSKTTIQTNRKIAAPIGMPVALRGSAPRAGKGARLRRRSAGPPQVSPLRGCNPPPAPYGWVIALPRRSPLPLLPPNLTGHAGGCTRTLQAKQKRPRREALKNAGD